MALCLIGLGSNLGDRSGFLDEALARLKRHPGIEVRRQSRYRETLPVGGPDAQPAYLNAAAVLQTTLSPHALLAALQGVEADLGRQRIAHWGPRTIDLDLLLYNDLTLAEPGLAVPHHAWCGGGLSGTGGRCGPGNAPPGHGLDHCAAPGTPEPDPVVPGHCRPHRRGQEQLGRRNRRKKRRPAARRAIRRLPAEAFYRNPSSHAWQIELEFLDERAVGCPLTNPSGTGKIGRP